APRYSSRPTTLRSGVRTCYRPVAYGAGPVCGLCSHATGTTSPGIMRGVRGVMREWFDPTALRRIGTTPDYRFSLANERTFLAWIRTGLALIAGGLAVAQFLPELRFPYLREALAVVLMIYGGAVALRALNHWVKG